MKRFVWILVFVLLLSMAMPLAVAAEEVDPKYDWDNMDWESFSFREYHFPELDTLWPWLRKCNDLHIVFLLTDQCDGADADMMGTILLEKLKQVPLTFIRELAKEEKRMQIKIADFIARMTRYNIDEDAVRLIWSLDPDALELQEEKAVLELMRDNVVKYWGDEIPKTGDPVVFIAAAMVLSGSAATTLLLKKKNVTGDW